ncbi:hypothetical protein [Mixta gaviniae]|uniref:Uncharacterized protein n=1 Tax=Mixta gaviniae TaxID=665914 RepID=A0A1X1E6D3_9GAMM|nr:hypothetical protein [Mixta gaviniae]AUX92410.1 hypothetical protein C2E15_04475 [Mixta gaviniae]ORM84480.1 hypothetical protein HA44_04905 [Mixta gaviniae]
MKMLRAIIYLIIAFTSVMELIALQLASFEGWQYDIHCAVVILLTLTVGHYFIVQIHNLEHDAKRPHNGC